MIKCTKCGILKQESDFYLTKNKKNGFHSQCKQCEYIWYRKRREKLGFKTKEERLKEIKEKSISKWENIFSLIIDLKSKPCKDCGKTFPLECMDFDHILGEKLNNISALVLGFYGEKTIRKELEKCEVVCANCHILRTHKRGEGWQKYWELKKNDVDIVAKSNNQNISVEQTKQKMV